MLAALWGSAPLGVRIRVHASVKDTGVSVWHVGYLCHECAQCGGPPGPSDSSSLGATVSAHRELQGASSGYVLTPSLSPRLLQLLSKYDPQKEAELRSWIEGLTGLSIGPDFQKGLKDGIILCT